MTDPGSQQLTERYTAEARSYRDLWAPVIFPPARSLVQELEVGAPERVLDLGSGVGLLLPELRRRFPSAVVIGVDRSEGMLALAGRDAPLAVMDALHLAFAPATFDLAILAFMLFHLADPVRGLIEVERALCPGGTVGLITWAGDMESPAAAIWERELEAHGAVSADSLPRLAHHDLMDTPEKVRGLLERAGFVSIRAQVRTFQHRMDRGNLVDLRSRMGACRARFESMDGPTRDLCRSRALEKLSLLPNEAFEFTLPLVFASARAPGRR